MMHSNTFDALTTRARRFAGASLMAIALVSAPVAAAAQAPQAAATQSAATGWGVPIADVKPDPAIRYGQLPNGMKYAIMRNAVPKGGASVRLHFDFGSIGEKDDERGLAHFIEHMAFNGSTNVPEGEMVKILERQGLKFGPDTNAVTGYDMTMYMLELPKADDEHVDTALMLMREVAGNVTFDPAAVERERGVLLGERRSRDTFQLHQIVDLVGFMMPETRFTERLPIGVPEVIKNAPAERLKALYHRYYRPENATFIFVGDADPAEIERKMRETFSDWRGVGAAGAELDRGSIAFDRERAFDTFVNAASPNQITIRSYRAWEDPVDTRAERREELVQALAANIFDRRMQRIVNSADSPIIYGGMSAGEEEELALSSSVIVVAKDGEWMDGVSIAEQELRRALEYGFTQSELDLQRTELRGKLQTAATQADARKHAAITNDIVQSIGSNELVTSPAWDLAYFEQVADGIKLAEVNAALREMWSGSEPLVHVASKTPLTGEQVASAFKQSTLAEVTPPVEQEKVEFAYDSFGTPGKIVADQRIEDLGVRTIRFANNVKLNIKTTDFEPGKVSYSVRMAGGPLVLPKDKPGLGMMLSMMSGLSATGEHSLEELKTLTAGKQVHAGMIASGDAFVSQGTTSADDLALQMKISAAYLTDPGLRPEATAQWQSLAAVISKQFDAIPGNLLNARLGYLLTQEDGRFGVPPGDMLVKRSFEELAPILEAAAAKAPIEVTIVGDVSEQAAIEAVASTFGALPARAASASIDPALRNVAFRPADQPIRLTHTGDADQAIVGRLWRTGDDSNYREEVGLEVLKAVMDLMLTDSVREKLGASYGVSVSGAMSSVYDDFGYVMVNSIVAPDKTGLVDDAIAEAAQSLRETPIDADLLARAKNPVLEEIAKDLRENNYWLASLDEAQTEPERLDRIRQRKALVEAVSAADIQKLARTYLVPERMIPVSVVAAETKPAEVAER